MSDRYIFIGGPFHGQIFAVENTQFFTYRTHLNPRHVKFPFNSTIDELTEAKYYRYYEEREPNVLGCEITLRGFIHEDYKENPFPIILGMLLGRALAK